MSTTTAKRPLAEAERDAAAFIALFHGAFTRWQVAGSVRRRKAEVGDVEHVVIPAFGEVSGGGLFGEDNVTVNLVWHNMIRLIGLGVLSPHVYDIHRADGTVERQTRLGEKYRGVDFKGFNHELFIADEKNWGSVLAIRTGPADFSQKLVTRLWDRRLENRGGYVRYKNDGAIYPVATEEAFFIAAGQEWVEPEKRA